MFQILVVCHANVCRSAYAATLLRSALPATEDFSIVSAGLGAAAGHPICPYVSSALGDDHRVSHASQPLDAELVARSDLILSMGPDQTARICAAWPETRHKVFGLVEAAVLAAEARRRGSVGTQPWDTKLPEALGQLRGLVEIPALRNPRGRWRGVLAPGRIADGHGLTPAGHRRVLEQVKQYTQLLSGTAAG